MGSYFSGKKVDKILLFHLFHGIFLYDLRICYHINETQLICNLHAAGTLTFLNFFKINMCESKRDTLLVFQKQEKFAGNERLEPDSYILFAPHESKQILCEYHCQLEYVIIFPIVMTLCIIREQPNCLFIVLYMNYYRYQQNDKRIKILHIFLEVL